VKIDGNAVGFGDGHSVIGRGRVDEDDLVGGSRCLHLERRFDNLADRPLFVEGWQDYRHLVVPLALTATQDGRQGKVGGLKSPFPYPTVDLVAVRKFDIGEWPADD